ncbi:MAG: Fic family protein [Fimbriimonadaceae bacterium]|nr:Fic family protein [Fimbriimonadaceae bacterium]
MPTYIHELVQWPVYTYDTAALLSDLEEVNMRRGRLFGILEAIGFDGLREQDVEALSEELVKSSAIEGEKLDLETVKNSVARRLGVDRGGLANSDHYIEGLVEMAIDATQRYDLPLTSERIFNWHAALFPTGRNAFGKVLVGKWRNDEKGPMVVASQKKGREVVHYEAPPAQQVPGEMTKFLKWVEGTNEESAILKAGIAHIWFETIHPMDDGNGRIGRNIMDMLLARADQKPHRPYSLASQIHLNRNAYYDVLEATQRGTLDYTEWLAWYLRILSNTLDSAVQAVGQAIERTRFWQNIRDIQLNDRQKKVISRMLMGWEGRMTNKKYAKLCDCSDATATRDLTDLVEKSILRSDGAGGRSVGYELVTISQS